MFMRHISGLVTDSVREWKKNRKQRKSDYKSSASHVSLPAVIPALPGHVGTPPTGKMVGVLIAAQLAWPVLNPDIPGLAAYVYGLSQEK